MTTKGDAIYPTMILCDLGRLRAEDLLREVERLRRRLARTRRGRTRGEAD